MLTIVIPLGITIVIPLGIVLGFIAINLIEKDRASEHKDYNLDTRFRIFYEVVDKLEKQFMPNYYKRHSFGL